MSNHKKISQNIKYDLLVHISIYEQMFKDLKASFQEIFLLKIDC